ncbi:MAG: nucleotidyltransferase domain-containing protein [Anaerolineae bacterium]
MAEQPSLPRLMALKERLVEALSGLPGACAVYLFGSLADGDADCYSDVDLQVLTTDLVAAQAALPAALCRVAAADLAWPLSTSLDDWCATVVWRDESPYHRADVGLSAVPAPGQLPPRMMAGGVPAWQGHCTAPWPVDGQEPLPLLATGTAGHTLVGHLISGLRYAKARKRGQSLVCWRYAAAIADWLATLLLERADGWQDLGRKINSSEYYRLDGVVPPEDRQRFADCLDFAMPAAMDASLCRLLGWMVELAHDEAAATGQAPPPAAAARLLRFLEAELPPAREASAAPAWPEDSHCGPRSRHARRADHPW